MYSIKENISDILDMIYLRYGNVIIDDPVKCEELLKSNISEDYTKEIKLLVTAAEEHIPHELTKLIHNRTNKEELYVQLTQRMISKHCYDQSACLWAIKSWAHAIGIADDRNDNNIDETLVILNDKKEKRKKKKDKKHNTSGTWTTVPEEVILSGFNGGAAGLPFFWLLSLKQWKPAMLYGFLSVLITTVLNHYNNIGVYCFSFLFQFLIAIFLGVTGNSLAWKCKKFKTIDEFKEFHRKWNIWGSIIMCVTILSYFIMIRQYIN